MKCLTQYNGKLTIPQLNLGITGKLAYIEQYKPNWV